jgi:hypothetical protein
VRSDRGRRDGKFAASEVTLAVKPWRIEIGIASLRPRTM